MVSIARLMRPVLVGVLAVFAFSSVVPGGGWVFDDHVLLERNADLHRNDVWGKSFQRDYYSSSTMRGNSGYYRPIALLVNALDVRMWRDAARGAHLTNLVLHVGASLLLPAALMALGVGALAAWVTAALFAAHPVHAESVAFVSGRVDVLATLFLLAAMACAARRGVVAALAVGLCTALAFLSKEIAFVTPLLLVLVWRNAATQNRWAPSWPRQQIVAVILAVLLVFALRFLALHALLPTTAQNARPAGAALLPVQSLLFALSSLYVPLRQISMEPDPQRLQAWRLCAGLVVALLLWGSALWRLPERAALRRALLAAGVSMVLVLNILPQETQLSERFLYLSSGFLLVPIGSWLAACWGSRRLRVVAAVVFVVVVGWWMMLSNWRGTVWRTDVSVWRQAVHEEPQRAAFWDRLGLALTERRSYSEAEVALQRAVDLEPRNANALHNMGVLLQSTRRPQQAVPFYQRALQEQPGNLQTQLNLGQVFLTLHDNEAALECFQTAVRLKPDHIGAYRNGIAAALAARKPEVARQLLQAGLRQSPNDPLLRQMEAKMQRARPQTESRNPPEDSSK